VVTLNRTHEIWGLDSNELQRQNSICKAKKQLLELELERKAENAKVLNRIKSENDPEPLHQAIKERIGLGDQASAGDWFLKDSKFQTWIEGMSLEGEVETVLWLKGISKCFFPVHIHISTEIL
jgi:hypothetical protein